MKRLVQLSLALGVLLALICVTAGALFYAIVLRDLPEIYALEDYRPKLVTRVLSRDGTEVGTFYQERREIVPIEEMPTYLVHAFIAAEDDAFYQHEGLDWAGILRAAIANLRAGKITQGGSTITQQVAKTFLLSSDRTWLRKLKDMVLARRIEKHFDKNEILFLYLNQIYLGSGAYGVEAAAQVYFGKPVKDLTLAESALIAGLVPAPSRYSPHVSLQAAQRRKRFVLRRMVEEGFISPRDREGALEQEPVFARPAWDPARAASAYFVEEVRRYLEQRYGSEELLTGGLTIRTTLDLARQLDAYRAVRKGLRDHDRRRGYRGPVRGVPRDEWPAVIESLADGSLEPPETGLDLAPALVTAVDDGSGTVRLALSPAREGTLTLEDLAWAREPDPEVDGAAVHLQRPSQALAPGNLVWLERREAGRPAAAGLEPISRYTLYQHPLAEGALVAMDVESGDVRAMVGGYSFQESQFNRAIQSRRQPGSSFKPVIYAAALEHGYTPATIVYDTPIVYEDQESGLLWKPGNYSRQFHGPITLRSALAHSRNVATIKILRDIRIRPVLRMARAIGITSDLEANLSLALGTSEVTLTELVRAYATFASGGHRVTPIFIREIRDRNGNLLEHTVPLLPSDRPESKEHADQATLEQVLDDIRASVDRQEHPDSLPAGYAIDPVTAYLTTSLLQAVVREGTGWRARALRRPIAGKTGTTNDLFDAWFVGFTPQVVTGVWVGYDVAANLGKNETGSRTASPIFVDYMRRALRDLPPIDFPVPDGIVFARIDARSGLLAAPFDRKALFQPFLDGTVPQEHAPTASADSPARATRLD